MDEKVSQNWKKVGCNSWQGNPYTMKTKRHHTNIRKAHVRTRQDIRWHFVVCFTFHWNRPHRKILRNIGNWKAYSYFFDTGRAHSFRIPNTEKSGWTIERGWGRGWAFIYVSFLVERQNVAYILLPFFNFHARIKTPMLSSDVSENTFDTGM